MEKVQQRALQFSIAKNQLGSRSNVEIDDNGDENFGNLKKKKKKYCQKSHETYSVLAELGMKATAGRFKGYGH